MGVGKYWTDALNPVKAGKRSYHCTKISPGCAFCWAELMNIEYCGGFKYDNRNAKLRLDPAVLEKTFHWKRKPRVVYVCHMCDLFHRLVPFEFVDEILAVAALTSRHKYLFLTKRPANQTAYFLEDRYSKVAERIYAYGKEDSEEIAVPMLDGHNWPPENCIFGTSIENQKYADERIPELMKLKTMLDFDNINLWLSVEPLLGLIELAPHFDMAVPDWVVSGGESGEHCRAMHRDWPRRVRDDCISYDVPFYFKQWGGFDKESAGRNLDGRTWDELPKMLQKENDIK